EGAGAHGVIVPYLGGGAVGIGRHKLEEGSTALHRSNKCVTLKRKIMQGEFSDSTIWRYVVSAVDFKEIPEAHKATGEQDQFELFVREFLVALGFSIIEGPERGIDRGRDLLVEETIRGTFSEEKKRWVVSAKHKAHSGASVNNDDEPDPKGRVNK